MKYEIDSKLKFGDRFYSCKLWHQDDDGGLVTDPEISEEVVETIILRKDGSVSYEIEPHFLTLEEAKKFCEVNAYNETLQLCPIENCTFEWIHKTITKVVDFDTGEKAELGYWHLVCVTEDTTLNLKK